MEKSIANINYLDRESLKVEFSYLIFNIESINKKFGSLTQFVIRHKLWGETNGKLYVLHEMVQPHVRLSKLVYSTLKHLGFKEYKDFVFGYEQLTTGVHGSHSTLINKEIPGLKKANWLGSIITHEGNFVWYRNIDDWKAYLDWRQEAYPQRYMDYYQMLLIKYLEKHNPEKLIFNPIVIELRYEKLLFGMRKHCGVLHINKERLGAFRN